ncbi:MAG: FemAB family XrtA/PEP-CTERM system-associated protein [Geminicoccaceae bacterium]
MSEVSLLQDAEEAAWDEFVATHPRATFFHRAGWRRVIGRTYRHDTPFLLARAGGEIRGVLPLIHVRSRFFGDALISTGFCVQGGILAMDATAETALAEAATALGVERRVAYVELRGEESGGPPGWSTKAGVYAGFRRELPVDEGENLKAIPRKKRADLRKALGSRLLVDPHADPGTFWPIYAESLRNLGTPVFPLRLVEALREEFGEAAEISLVRDAAARPLAALVSFYFKDQVLPYYGGAVPAARPVHAYDLLYWSLMRRAVTRGARVFDFGRSKIGTGAYDYKRFWGFEPEPLRYRYRLIRARSLPNVNPLNPKYRLMVEAWRRLPLPVANRFGPWLARHLA